MMIFTNTIFFRQDITLYATRDIPGDSVISATYTHTLWDTPRRRDHLWRSKCFWCRCRRCADPSEFGTWLSCGACPGCGGRVAPADPLDPDPEAEWRCDKCSRATPAGEMARLTAELSGELRSARWDRADPDSLERFLKEHAHRLPDDHSLAREVQQAIVNLYRAKLADIMENGQLLRKSFLCEMRQLHIILHCLRHHFCFSPVIP